MSADGDELGAALRGVLKEAFGAGVEVTGMTRLSGGASRQTWSLDATRPGGSVERLVLRRDHPGAPPSGLRLEAGLLQRIKALIPVRVRVLCANPGG